MCKDGMSRKMGGRAERCGEVLWGRIMEGLACHRDFDSILSNIGS